MDMQLVWAVIKMLIALPIVLLLAYASLKLGKNYMSNLGKGRNIKVLETVPISNKSFVSVVKIGNQFMVLGISEHNVNLLKMLTNDEIKEFNAEQAENANRNRYLIKRSQINKLKSLLGYKTR